MLDSDRFGDQTRTVLIHGYRPMLQIRLARVREATSLATMSRELIEQGLGWSWRPQRMEKALRDRETNVIVAEKDGRRVGFAAMKYLEETAHLLLFAVQPTDRRQGVGRAMWQWLSATVETAGIRQVHLEVRARNTDARTFYRQFGFIEAETVRGYYRGIEAAIIMRRDFVETESSRPD